jgi:hypothetical protein
MVDRGTGHMRLRRRPIMTWRGRPVSSFHGSASRMEPERCAGEAITREIITNLSRFRDLAVIAPHSALLFKNLQLSPGAIGQQLGVRFSSRVCAKPARSEPPSLASAERAGKPAEERGLAD